MPHLVSVASTKAVNPHRTYACGDTSQLGTGAEHSATDVIRIWLFHGLAADEAFTSPSLKYLFGQFLDTVTRGKSKVF